jgi:hypothetical protein
LFTYVRGKCSQLLFEPLRLADEDLPVKVPVGQAAYDAHVILVGALKEPVEMFSQCRADASREPHLLYLATVVSGNQVSNSVLALLVLVRLVLALLVLARLVVGLPVLALGVLALLVPLDCVLS